MKEDIVDAILDLDVIPFIEAPPDRVFVCRSGHLDRTALQWYSKRAKYCCKVGCDNRVASLDRDLVKAIYMKGRAIASEA